jgi:hypothetical protein
MLSLREVYYRSASVQWQPLEDGAVVLELESGNYYTLNDVAQRIWDLLDGERSLEEIQAIVQEEFDVSEETVNRDLRELIEFLVAEKLITMKNSN